MFIRQSEPAIAQLVERRTVDVQMLISLGHRFDSGSREGDFLLAAMQDGFDSSIHQSIALLMHVLFFADLTEAKNQYF